MFRSLLLNITKAKNLWAFASINNYVPWLNYISIKEINCIMSYASRLMYIFRICLFWIDNFLATYRNIESRNLDFFKWMKIIYYSPFLKWCCWKLNRKRECKFIQHFWWYRSTMIDDVHFVKQTNRLNIGAIKIYAKLEEVEMIFVCMQNKFNMFRHTNNCYHVDCKLISLFAKTETITVGKMIRSSV